MGAVPPDPGGFASLTRHEQRVLPPPRWMIWMGRPALILIPLILLVPVAWLIGIAAAMAVLSLQSRVAGRRS